MTNIQVVLGDQVDDQIYVGIVGDGSIDRAILSHIVQLFPRNKSVQIVWLTKQTIRDGIDKFWKLEKCLQNQLELEKTVINVLIGALNDFKDKIPRETKSCDFIIFHSDSEKYLKSSSHYFEEWAWVLSKIMLRGIEKFYHKMSEHGYSIHSLPEVLPFIPFPSTEILLISTGTLGNINGRNKAASVLKETVYGTTNPNKEELENAISSVNKEHINNIYRCVPEIRLLFHSLSNI